MSAYYFRVPDFDLIIAYHLAQEEKKPLFSAMIFKIS